MIRGLDALDWAVLAFLAAMYPAAILIWAVGLWAMWLTRRP